MDGSWKEIENEILGYLAERGAIAPDEVGRELGISEGAAASLLSILARAGKVRIRLVELMPPARDGDPTRTGAAPWVSPGTWEPRAPTAA